MQFLTPLESINFQDDRDRDLSEPVDLLSEHLQDAEAKKSPDAEDLIPPNNDFRVDEDDDDDDDDSEIFKQAVQHPKPDLTATSLKDEL